MQNREAVMRSVGEPGDLGWVVQAHGEQYAAEYGWDAMSMEGLTARIVGDFAAAQDPAREAGWIAELDGRRVGCVFCVSEDDTTAKLRLLLVDPAARGHRLGTRLVDQCLEFARSAGYRRMRLWTNQPLASARRIYLAAGFRLVQEQPHRDFGVEILGQVYELDL
ncbi:GNAT family N-acetyltransferase [Streptacidiphilus carbonis]|jgi:GNAT superfamily N-acetyltransferase|uniref:GNAT family N-acetyltransferase n=1 Tax=Streptacidiphilus carbonis TaxID=105422 RepID=UPI0005A62DB5|nr:GNAT family N-acetyltransferase [Streptacidiphilus carbonis]